MYQLAPDEFIEAMHLDTPDARPFYLTFALPQSH
jgi:hypothetical protein